MRPRSGTRSRCGRSLCCGHAPTSAGARTLLVAKDQPEPPRCMATAPRAGCSMVPLPRGHRWGPSHSAQCRSVPRATAPWWPCGCHCTGVGWERAGQGSAQGSVPQRWARAGDAAVTSKALPAPQRVLGSPALQEGTLLTGPWPAPAAPEGSQPKPITILQAVTCLTSTPRSPAPNPARCHRVACSSAGVQAQWQSNQFVNVCP